MSGRNELTQQSDSQIIAEFLEGNYSLFQEFLVQKYIEPTEAESMIDALNEDKS